MTSVCILDYGSGNVRSVANLFQSLPGDLAVVLSNDPADIRSATHLVLPGVGAFGAAMQAIRKRIPLDVVEEAVLRHEKPFLGICVGLQVLATYGEEFGRHEGLGWLPGRTRALKAGSLPVPHVGWNDVEAVAPGKLLAPRPEDYYFVHSYVFEPESADHCAATTTYGEQFCSAAHSGNIWGVQFHPEKSQGPGARLIQRFLSMGKQ